MNLKHTKLVIDRSRFDAGQYDINLANEAERELAATQARIEKLETENTRLNKIIHAVEVASRRRLKSGETVYNILSAAQDALESA